MLYSHDWKTMVNNCRVLQCFGPLNQVAADSMAEMTGFVSGNAMLDLGRNEMVLQLAGDEAVVAQVPNYLADPAFHSLYDRNPYHDPNRSVMPREGARQRMYARPGQEAPSVAAGTIDKVDPLLRQLLEKSAKD